MLRDHRFPRNVKVLFECAVGHRFWLYTMFTPGTGDLVSQTCPRCGRWARWLTMDYHYENA